MNESKSRKEEEEELCSSMAFFSLVHLVISCILVLALLISKPD